MDKRIEVLGIAYDQYNQAVRARIYRDLLGVQDWCRTRQIRLVVACPDNQVRFVTDNLGITVLDDPRAAKYWLCYQTRERPEYVPDGDDITIVTIDVQPPRPESKQIDTGPHMNPSVPREQGRDATMINLIDRPSPNPYAPTSPSGLAILFGT